VSRGTRLLDRPPDDIAVLLSHPVQLRTAALIAELITELRTARAASDFYEFQRVLAAHVFEAQERQAEASRNVKRVRTGRPVPEPEAPSWDLCLALWDRVVRQLRAVGDALAWRLFGFDRRYVLALSRNQPPGPMVGKAGLESELGAVTEAWEQDGRFALLHDLTNSIRIADITIFEDRHPTLVEIKRTPAGGSRHRDQVRRAKRAVAVINDGAPLPGPEDTELVVSEQTFKASLPALRRQLEQALDDGVACRSIGSQQVVTALAVTAKTDLPVEQLLARSEQLKHRAFDNAGLPSVDHHLRGVRADSIGKDASLAPFTIFPFDPNLVAALTTDLVSFEHVIGWDRVGQAFEAHGFVVELLLEDASGPGPADVAVLVDQRADRRITLHSGGLDQALHEFINLDRYVAAIAPEVRRRRRPGKTPMVLTFTNERATWR
jgi:hypothetical protein